MIVERKYTAHGISLNAGVATEPGSPLLVLHGLLRRWQTFTPLLGSWGSGFQIHALDHRGHGDSAKSLPSYLVRDYVADAVALTQAQGWRDLVIYGHSLGAMTAMGIAAQLPDQVRAILLEDPPLSTMGARILNSPWHVYFRQVFEALPLPEDLLAGIRHLEQVAVDDPITGRHGRLGELRDSVSLRLMVSALRKLDPEVLRPVVEGRWMEGYDWQADVAQIRCPVLMLQGDPALAGMLTDEDARFCKRTIPDCTVVRMTGVGHVMHWPRTQDVLNQTWQFLSSL